ncbi:MAG: aldo/keto reductase [Oculatellaceae cyanobacterium bins.114]|nr:aldo/keto reductase [Oculatellaceae cyanobacterium bins.114]
MKTVKLGKTDIVVSALGLGTSSLCKRGRPPEEQAIATIHRALDLGITLIDTADVYCLDESEKHYGELLIRKALTTYTGDSSQVVVATRGGCLRINGELVNNGNPTYLRQAIRKSFEALGGKKPIDLWMYHRPDPNYTVEESLKPAQEALASGMIRSVGVSNISLKQLQRAREIVDITAVENQYNLWQRKNESNGILGYCEREKITFLPWSPLGGVGGVRRTKSLDDLSLLSNLAKAKGVSVYCILLAWLRAKSSVILPIPGASRPATIEDSVKAMTVTLSTKEVAQIDALLPPSLFDRGIFAWMKRYLKQLTPIS